MFGTYFDIFFYFLVGIGLVLIIYFLNWFLAPRTRSTGLRDAAYECGDPAKGDGWGLFHLGFYPYAILFVVFDVEAIFLFAWVAAFKSLGVWGVLEVLAFIAVLVVGLLYAWRKGVLKWV